jgi:hypothetical protein
VKVRRCHLRSAASYRISMCGLLQPVDAEERRAFASISIDLVPDGESLELFVRRMHAEAEVLRKLRDAGRVK